MRSRILAFVGPSLPSELDSRWEKALGGIEVWPPAQRGDILRALGEDPEILVLIDGYYFTVPAVTHKELLYALESGVTVIGAASMGALRATEMAPFGMQGVGRIFERFHSGQWDGDDEVAVVHTPSEKGFESITVALAEVRLVLEDLRQSGEVVAESVSQLVDGLKALPFTERYPETLRRLAEECLGPSAPFFLRHLEITQPKSEDALLALEMAQGLPALRHGDRPRPREVSTFLSFFREWTLREKTSESTEPLRPPYRRAWGAAQVLHPGTSSFVETLRWRFLLASAALEQGLEGSSETQARHLERFQTALEDQGVRLPPAEIDEEAERWALAETLWQKTPDLGRALEPLARKLRFSSATAPAKLLDLLDWQEGLMPQWFLVRSFLGTAAARPAIDLARAIDEVERAFHAWSEGAEVTSRDLDRMLGELWHLSPEAIREGARRRALYPSHGFADGLFEICRWMAPAERLSQPINDYRKLRERLLATSLEVPWSVTPGHPAPVDAADGPP